MLEELVFGARIQSPGQGKVPHTSDTKNDAKLIIRIII